MQVTKMTTDIWEQGAEENIWITLSSQNSMGVTKQITKWSGHVPCIRWEKDVRKSEAKKQLGRPGQRYKNYIKMDINPLKPELNHICYLLALLGAHHFLHVSRIRVKLHWSTKFHFFFLAEMKWANSYVNWAAEHENHNENASFATVFELSCLTCTTQVV